MGLVNAIFQAAIWVAIIAMLWRKFEQPVQETLVTAGVLEKRLTLDDVCEWIEDCPTMHNLLGCELKSKIPEAGGKPKLRVRSKLLKKKTCGDRINDALNAAFLWCQSFIIPEEYQMPCLFGDCGMDQEIKRQKDILMFKDKKGSKSAPKSPLRPHKADNEPKNAEDGFSPTPHMAANDEDTPKPNF